MKVAVVQLNAQTKKTDNVKKALHFVQNAVCAHAELICLPEVFNYRGPLQGKIHNVAENIPGESTAPFFEEAQKSNVFILLGSVCEKKDKKKKAYNTSLLIDPRGKVASKYRKINLFKAVVGHKAIDESKNLLPGKKICCAPLKGFVLGMTICYDLRFPEVYRSCAKQGCDLFAVPSNFTQMTGQAHWEVLLRARAIENLCYVLAPNQTGKDEKGIAAYGNSMIVDPWGKILARASADREEILYAEINQNALREARRKLPLIAKKRLFV